WPQLVVTQFVGGEDGEVTFLAPLEEQDVEPALLWVAQFRERVSLHFAGGKSHGPARSGNLHHAAGGGQSLRIFEDRVEADGELREDTRPVFCEARAPVGHLAEDD